MASKWITSVALVVAAAGVSSAQAPLPVESAAESVAPAAAAAPAENVSAPAAPPPARFTPAASDASSPPVVLPPRTETASAFQEPICPYDANSISTHADYLLWFYKRVHTPTIFGTVPPALARGGELPPNSIIPVFGGGHNNIDYGGQSGARFGLDAWFDNEQTLGLDLDYFQLQPGTLHVNGQSSPNGLPIIGPVFRDPVAQKDVIILFSDPGSRSATVNASAGSRFWGAEVNFTRQITAIFADHLELLAGYRHVEFNEDLNMSGSSIAADPRATSLAYVDAFGVHNRFDGPQIGLASDFVYNHLFLNLKAKIAVGEMNERVQINGATDILSPTPSQAPGGVLTQPSNIGGYNHTVFTFLPEVTVNTGVQLGDHMRAFVGYNLIYLDRLERAGAAIDGVDQRQVRALNFQPNMNATRPTFQYQDGRFWAYGLNLGLEFSF